MGRKLVHGLGINDADYVVRPGGRRRMCPYYKVWANMLNRCYSKTREQRFPTYKGCQVCKKWLTFSKFKAWMLTQDWRGKQLDKDLLGKDMYSPSGCLFVTKKVNMLTVGADAIRGELPIGVSWDPKNLKFKAQISIDNRAVNLGRYASVNEATQAWRSAKKAICQKLMNKQRCLRTKQAIRKYMRSI